MEEKLVREKREAGGGGVKTAENKKSEESITSFGEMRQATFVPLRNSFACMTHYKEINQFWAIQRQRPNVWAIVSRMCRAMDRIVCPAGHAAYTYPASPTQDADPRWKKFEVGTRAN